MTLARQWLRWCSGDFPRDNPSDLVFVLPRNEDRLDAYHKDDPELAALIEASDQYWKDLMEERAEDIG